MRVHAWFAVALACGCHASASVENTLPIANLQSISTVGLRVSSATMPQQTKNLEAAVVANLRAECAFAHIAPKSSYPSDLQIDVNIMAMGRGGDNRYIRNPNLATIDTLVVLTDGQSGELLGTSRIHGVSSGMVTPGMPPEREAIDVVAKTIADVLAKSGCGGPRIARVEPPPPPAPPPGPPPSTDPGTPGTPPPPPPPDESHRAEAEALNTQGTEKLQNADAVGALALFTQANTLMADPKYLFNACLTLESEAQWDQAIVACRQAKTMNPEARLAAKIDHRLDLLAQHQ